MVTVILGHLLALKFEYALQCLKLVLVLGFIRSQAFIIFFHFFFLKISHTFTFSGEKVVTVQFLHTAKKRITFSHFIKKIIIFKKAPTTVQICKLENIEHKSMK